MTATIDNSQINDHTIKKAVKQTTITNNNG